MDDINNSDKSLKVLEATEVVENNKRGFVKGQSGNPGGRPKILKEFRQWLATHAYPLAQRALIESLQSEDEAIKLAAVKEVHNRMFGQSSQAITGEDGGPIRHDVAILAVLKKLAGESDEP